MNKRQIKKRYKAVCGHNPSKWMGNSTIRILTEYGKRTAGNFGTPIPVKSILESDHIAAGVINIPKPQEIINLENFNRIMTIRRKKCRKQKWIR